MAPCRGPMGCEPNTPTQQHPDEPRVARAAIQLPDGCPDGDQEKVYSHKYGQVNMKAVAGVTREPLIATRSLGVLLFLLGGFHALNGASKWIIVHGISVYW